MFQTAAPTGTNEQPGSKRQDVYSRVTQKIMADLERGVRPWMKPWSTENVGGRVLRPLRHDGTPYRGINIVMLWAEATEKGYGNPHWMTYRQAVALGGQVRKGEHGSLVVYADKIKKTETDESGEESERSIPFMKGYTVFNVEQIDGLPERYSATPENPAACLLQRIEHAERFVASTLADIRHGGNRAYYAEGPDHVQVPPLPAFNDRENYYATLLHELTHWTKHKSRLDRDLGRKRWGDEGYAREELVAELGAAFLCADLGITPDVREDHASYVASWLKVLSDDKRAIFQAAAHAQRAADYLAGLQNKNEGA